MSDDDCDLSIDKRAFEKVAKLTSGIGTAKAAIIFAKNYDQDGTS